MRRRNRADRDRDGFLREPVSAPVDTRVLPRAPIEYGDVRNRVERAESVLVFRGLAFAFGLSLLFWVPLGAVVLVAARS